MADDTIGLDLSLPVAPGEGLEVTPTGDLRTVSGRENLVQALRNRALAVPGHLVHRPEYGGGLSTWVEELDEPTGRARRAASLRRQLLRDSRLVNAGVRIAPASTGQPLTVALDAEIRDAEDGRLTLALET